MQTPDLPPRGIQATEADPTLLRAVARATGAHGELLGELGRRDDASYFLVRDHGHESLRVLEAGYDRSAPAGGEAAPELRFFSELSPAIPAEGNNCGACGTVIDTWRRFCPHCAADVSGIAPGGGEGTSPADLLRVARSAMQGRCDFVGEMQRSEGGGHVYFGRDRSTGSIVALRLERRTAGPRSNTYALGVTGVIERPITWPGTGGTPIRAPAGPPPTGQLDPHPSGYQDAAAAGSAGSANLMVCPTCDAKYEAGLSFCPLDGSSLVAEGRASGLDGHLVADRYRIVRQLGEGGMGQVYLAEHVKMGRKVAIKMIHLALAHDPQAVARFAREATTASQIQHPNVATIFDFGETDEGVVYLAMEYIEGPSLSRILAEQGALEPGRAASLAWQVADALAAAHARGIIHRDLKPDNIVVTAGPEGEELVKVVDFGIAKPMQERTHLTRTGLVIGTPQYMSPEQLLGEPLDGRSDVYSLGCVLYEMLTGGRPFSGPSDAALIARRLTEAPPPLRERVASLPAELEAIVEKALAREAAARYESAAALRDDLRELYGPLARTTGEGTVASPGVRGATGKRAAAAAARTAGARLNAAARGATAAGSAGVPSTAAPWRSTGALTMATIGIVVLVGAAIGIRAVRRGAAALPSPSPAPLRHEAAGEGAPGRASVGGMRTAAAATSSAPVSESASAGAAQPGATPPTAATNAGATAAGGSSDRSASPAAVEVSRLTIVGDAPAGLALTVDGHLAGRGIGFVLPPGQHWIVAEAPDHETVRAVVELKPGQTRVWLLKMTRVARPATLLRAEQPAAAPVGSRNQAPSPPASAPASAAPASAAPVARAAPAAARDAAGAEIARAVSAFVAAINSRDMAQLRGAWPGMGKDEVASYGAFLRDVRKLTAVRSGSSPPEIDGNVARATFTVDLIYEASAGGRRTDRPSFEAIANYDAGWHLLAIRPRD